MVQVPSTCEQIRSGSARARRRAMTLVECMVATAILAGVSLAASLTLTTGAQHVAYADRASRSARLGRDLMQEIRSKAYDDPNQTPLFGPESGEKTRSDFDDVDDFHGWKQDVGSQTTATGELYDAEDQRFSRSVTVTDVSQSVSDLGVSVPGRLVTVVVKHQSGEKWQFVQFIPKPN
jgi:prepilin-type N-terminal cleavage/methylation domain-containing protein